MPIDRFALAGSPRPTPAHLPESVMTDYLTEGAVVANLKATSKKQALQELAKRAASLIGEDERTIFNVLLERERLGSTGVGRGIAIPHGKLAGLARVHGLLAKLDRPIDFDAIDDEPVDLVFLLLAPEQAGADHLKALARVSRMLRDESFCRKIRGCESGDAMRAILAESTTDTAA